ncbi:hypothetical protein AAZX31_08G266500 [Glycine max]|uniref:ATP-dependent DNA helicase n=1 Tax=Glycine max TaxID=3847 RepID=A0A0R0ITB3_SOYBN|nr:hypothetical protein GYH30_022593 [Glycine max]
MQCRYCNAQMWYDERISKDKNCGSPRFSLCCGDGKVELPLLQNPPQYLQQLLFDDNTIDSKNYQHNLRAYNMIQYSRIQGHIVSSLSHMLDEHNSHAKSFRMARDKLTDDEADNIKLQLIAAQGKDGHVYNMPNVPEIVALIVGDFHPSSKRDIIVETQNGELQRIHELHPSYLPLQYLLLFPYGEDGYRVDIRHRSTSSNKKRKQNRLTMRKWFAYRLQSRSNEAMTLLHSRKLFQQFIVEGYIMVESERLSYIRNNQKKLRVDKYCSLQNSLDTGTTKGLTKGKRVILPSTFVGSPRYMDQLYFDGMAMCSHVGFPNLFITLTCNPNWLEIRRLLSPLNLKPTDRPDIVSRIFILKYEQMLSDLTNGQLLGKVVAYMHTIEFQKRELPHVHLLLFLHPDNKYSSSTDIDQIISAEIPSHKDDPELYRLVQNHMIHGPCGILQPNSPCMKEGKCSRFYPKQFHPQTLLDSNGYPVYRRRNNGHSISKNGVIIDNRYIVPYNPKLLKKYQAHINIEWCNQSTSIKYLFKYINKGYDRVTAIMVCNSKDTAQNVNIQNDEFKEYLDCRYISPCEAAWRIFAFPIHGRKPTIERLYFHLLDQHSVLYEDHDDVLSKPTISYLKFLAWMNTNKCFAEGRSLIYSQFVSKFKKKGYTIGRLIWVPPTTEELFYLRMMLGSCKGPTSFEDIRTIANIQYATYREAYFAMGFVQDYRKYVEAIKKAKDWGTTNYLRKLFVLILLTGAMSKPEEVWNQCWHWLADDIAYRHSKSTINSELHINDDTLRNLTLIEIEQLLHTNQRSLKDYPTMPYPQDINLTSYLQNNLVLSELDYNHDTTRSEFEHLFASMTCNLPIHILQILLITMFFLYGFGGTGKTFIWRTFASSLRADNQIVIIVASSGIASLLLPGGRTALSRFKIPVPIFEDSTCNIHQGIQLAELLNQTSLIIWDEAPMAHKFCFEALDQSLRDIITNKSNSNQIFGGKVIVFGGDFCQILPVIPRGSRSDIINATINSSYLWNSCEILTLTKNMRLHSNLESVDEQENATFAKWILDIGDGIIGHENDGYATIEIPAHLLITEYDDPISDHMEYLSSDSVDKLETIEDSYFQSITTKFLNSLTTSGLPTHSIKLKIGSPIMLLRNLDQNQGMCNGTRLVVTKLAKHVIAAEIISGKNIGLGVYIPRMSMSPSQSPWPFKPLRRQFPIMLSYAMTINKSQGQSLSMVGLYLPKPVFTHGQLYVALSRVNSAKGLKIMIHDNEQKSMNSTTNVVFKEVLRNIKRLI